MGAIMSDKFDIEFINQTKKIIRAYKGNNNVTLLLEVSSMTSFIIFSNITTIILNRTFYQAQTT